MYNIGGNNERTNLEITEAILTALNKSRDLIRFVADRPGHDRRYAIDSSKIKRELGWEPSYTFDRAMEETVSWYVENRWWWEEIKSGQYQEYYKNFYGDLT